MSPGRPRKQLDGTSGTGQGEKAGQCGELGCRGEAGGPEAELATLNQNRENMCVKMVPSHLRDLVSKMGMTIVSK